MRQYISEARAAYEDMYHGLFSRRLAEWAIGGMKTKDSTSKELKAIKPRTVEDVQEVLSKNNVKLPDEFIYTSWYLFNMAVADYPATLKTDELRASYVEETLCDPDCCPEAVLECFIAKMCLMGVPIYWERML